MFFRSYDEARVRTNGEYLKKKVGTLITMLLLIAFSAYRGITAQSMTATALGTVADWKLEHRSDEAETYTLVIQFEDSDHRTYKAKTITQTTFKPVGTPVTVNYDPRDPEKGVIIKGAVDASSLYYDGSDPFLIVASLILVIFVYVKLLRPVKKRHRQRPKSEAGEKTASEDFVPFEWEDDGDRPQRMSI